MSTATLAPITTASLGALPKVDLLPPEIAAERRFVRVRASLAGAVVLAVGAVGGLYAVEAGNVEEAQAALDAARTTTSGLDRQVDDLAEVPQLFAQVDAGRVKLRDALGAEVRWSYQLNELSLNLPPTVWVDSLTVTQAAPVAPPVTDGSATGGASVAGYTLSVAGKAEKVQDVADWLEVLDARDGYATPFFSTAQMEVEDGRKTISFESTVQIGGEALSDRYDLTPEPTSVSAPSAAAPTGPAGAPVTTGAGE